LIDSFLKTKNAEVTLNRAFQIVKPFYFNMINERIEEESSKLLNAMKYQENRNEVLSHYLLHEKNPGMKDNYLLSQLENYHEVREVLKDLDRAKPLESRQWKEREFMNELGTGVDRDAAVTEQE